ncbi:MAG: protein-tyrosine-phosphatase [Anaerolineaceae bacterium]|nr:protein-tyrosine-phosphatase [Anaerolineaceae bacterium]
MVLNYRRVGQRVGLLVAVAPLMLLATGCTAVSSITGDSPPQPRMPRWATPLQKPGLPNLFQVSDSLYRSAQPAAEGFRQLKALGVKTVLNLRSAHSDRNEIGDTDLAYEHIWFRTWHPEDEDVVRFLRIVTNPDRTPVLVHCQRGADRTGMMCAIYRVAVNGWSKDEAIREMTDGGFGFDDRWQNLVKYIRQLDVDELKRKASLGQQE